MSVVVERTGTQGVGSPSRVRSCSGCQSIMVYIVEISGGASSRAINRRAGVFFVLSTQPVVALSSRRLLEFDLVRRLNIDSRYVLYTGHGRAPLASLDIIDDIYPKTALMPVTPVG